MKKHEQLSSVWSKDAGVISEYLETKSDMEKLFHELQSLVAEENDNFIVFKRLNCLAEGVFIERIQGSEKKYPQEFLALQEFMYSWQTLYTLNVPYNRWSEPIHLGVQIAREGIKRNFKSLDKYLRHRLYDVFQKRLMEARERVELDYPELADPMGI